MQPYTDEEWDTLPHVVWTSDENWDPSVLDHTLDDDDAWFDSISDESELLRTSNFDERGDYCHCVQVQWGDVGFFNAHDDPISEDQDDIIDHCVCEAVTSKVALLHHIPGALNPADILSKHWGHAQVWKILQPILFYPGDTSELYEE